MRGDLPDQDVRQMEELLGATWAREGVRAALHFGLGHYHDGRSEHDKAATHFAEANAAHVCRIGGWHLDQPRELTRKAGLAKSAVSH